MMKRYLLYFLACFVMSLGVMACGDDGGGGDNNGTSQDLCEVNEDCEEDQQCFSGVCRGPSDGEECSFDTECEEWEYCGEGTCQLAGCSADEQCADGTICQSGRCAQGCREDEECGDGMMCNESNECVQAGCNPGECASHMECKTDLEPAACEPDGSCTTEIHCTRFERFLDDGVDYICDGERCIQKPACTADEECETGEICDEGTCRAGCRDDDGCLLGEYCEEGTYQCIQGCVSDGDCLEGETCVENDNGEPTCEISCSSRDDCEVEGEVCFESYCQSCTDDNQCFGLEFCDMEQLPEEGKGLCRPLPPECPEDAIDEESGGNETDATAYNITQFPFEHADDESTEDDESLVWCDEHTAGEWFSLSAEPGKVIVVEIEYDNNNGGNLDLALFNSVGENFDEAGEELAVSARPPTTDNGVERIEFGVNPNRTGALDTFIQVRGSAVDPKIPYSITIDVRDPDPCTDDAYEANDTPDEAQYINTSDPTALQGSARDLEVCGDDPDWYKVDVPANHILEVSITSDSNLGAVDAILSEPQSPDIDVTEERDVVGNTTRYTLSSSDPQTFNINVFMAEHVGDAEYDIGYIIIPNDCIDVAEPNESCADSPLVSDTSSYGDLAICHDEEDYYKVALNPLDRLTVTATYKPAESAGDMNMSLFGPSRSNPYENTCDNLLATAVEHTGQNPGEVDVVIADFEAQVGGEYYIHVNLFLGLIANYELDIDVTAGPDCEDDRFDTNGNNDDAANATTLVAGDVTGNGPDSALVGQRICDTNQDWFEITIGDGQTLTWELSHTESQGEIDAGLFEDDGSGGASPVMENGEQVTLDANDQINVTNNSGGDKTYYLRVAGMNDIPVRNDYWLFTEIDGDGPIDKTCPDVFEDNDVPAEAAEVSDGTHDNLLICSSDAAGGDWYRTMVQAGETLTVSATFAAPVGNPWLQLYQESDTGNHVVQASGSGDTYTASYTSARDQYIYYRLDTSPGVTGDAYTLNVDVTQAETCEDDRFAANHSATDAAEGVDAPGLFMGLMHCDDNADWFEVQLTEEELFEAYINYDNEVADLDVEIYDPADTSTPLATGDVSAQYLPPADSDDTTTYTATYLVRVASADSSVSVRLPYDLLLYRDMNDDGVFSVGEGPEDRECPDAYENNDNESEAAEIPAGSYSDLRLCVGNPTDDDYYSVFVPAGATITAEIGFDPEHNVNLYLKEGNSQVDSGTQPVGHSSETVTHTNNSSLGTEYIIHVDGGTGSYQTSYTLDVSLQFSTSCDEDGFGAIDSMAVAATPDAGAYELTLCEATDDWFEVILPAGEELEANAELRNRLGNIDLELVDENGNQKAVAATDENIEELVYTNDTGSEETLYLRVHAKDDAFMRNDYDLWLAIGSDLPDEPYCPDAYERNDTVETAANLDISSESQFHDMIACGEEEDWYAVNLQSSTTYELDVFFDHSSGGVDLDLALLDGNGNAVEDSNSDDIDFGAHSGDDDEQVSFQVPSSGTYFLGVKNHGTAADTYRVYFAPQSASCPEDTFEDNDNTINAAAIGPELPIDLALAACGDDDIFSWTAPADGEVTFTMYLDNTSVHLGMEIEDFATGTRMGRDIGVSNPTDDNRATITFDAVQGETYIIEITRGQLNGQLSDGAYFLTVE